MTNTEFQRLEEVRIQAEKDLEQRNEEARIRAVKREAEEMRRIVEEQPGFCKYKERLSGPAEIQALRRFDAMTHNRWYEFTGRAGMWNPTVKICLNLDEVIGFEEYTKEQTIVLTKGNSYASTLVLCCAYEDFKTLLLAVRGESVTTIPASKVADK